MSNTITIELCAEDRARLDRLAEAMERRTCDKCVTSAIQLVKNEQAPVEAEAPKEINPVVEAPVEETPTQKDPEPQTTVRTVDRAELRAKVIDLSAKGLKDQVRDIVKTYAATVKDVPEDKLAECFDKLVALGG